MKMSSLMSFSISKRTSYVIVLIEIGEDTHMIGTMIISKLLRRTTDLCLCCYVTGLNFLTEDQDDQCSNRTTLDGKP